MQIATRTIAPAPLLPMPMNASSLPAVHVEPSRTAAVPYEDPLDVVRRDIRAQSSIQPIHTILAMPHVYAAEADVERRARQFEAVHNSRVPLVIKSLVAGAGMLLAGLFWRSSILQPTENTIGTGLIIFMTVLALPVVGAELTSRRLRKEFELIPLRSQHLPSVEEARAHGCTPEQFNAFVEEELLPRVPRGHARSLAGDCGTCLHDVRRWGLEDCYYTETTWETVCGVIVKLGVDQDTAERAKAALLAIERDRAPGDDVMEA